MKSKHLLLMLLLALLAPWAANGQQSLPYSYGFEDNDLSTDGWTTQNPSGLNASEFGINASAAQTGNYGFRFSSYDDGGTSTQYLISPELSAASGVVVQFSYKISSSYSSGEKFKVGYSTTNADISSFTFGDEVNATNTAWALSEEYVFPAGTKYVAIYYYPDYQYRLYVDDFTFEAPASCVKPSGLTATLTPGNGSIATLSWTAGSTETNWVLEYGTASDFSGATSVNVSGTPSKNLTGLTAEATYYARVKADCGGGDVSGWCSTVCEFKPTNALTLTVYDGTTTGNVPLYSNNQDYANHSEYIIPAADLASIAGVTIESIQLYASYTLTTGTTQVYLMEVADETFSGTAFYGPEGATIVYEGALNISSTDGMTVTFTEGYDYNGGNLLIGFAKDYTSGYSYGSFYGQEVSGASISGYSSSGYSSISATQRNFLPKTTISYSLNAFPKPKNLTVSNITNNSATITWEAPTSGTPTSYKYQYMPEGGSWTTLTSTTALTAPITGLTGNTNYTVQVQAIYAGGESGFASKTFTTDCDAYPIPYAYGFEDVSDMNCWTKENIVSSGISDETSFGAGVPARTGNNFYVFQYVEYTSQSLPYQTIISPELSGITNGLHVEFYYRKYTNGEETFRVGYSTTDNDLASFTWGNEIDNATTDYQRFSANYPASTKYIAVQHTSDDQYYLFLDDFLFEEAAACLEPTNILVDNITTDGATVSWTPGASETAWDIFVTGDNTIVPDDGTTPTYANVTTNTNYPISGLTSGTSYYVFVRSACDATTHSEWSMHYHFNTECEAISLPYSYDFEDDALPVCWNIINPNTSYNTVGIVELSTNKLLGFYRGTSATMAAVLPEVDANYQLNEYEITFDACYANTSSTSMTLGKLTVGIMTDPEDFSTFQPVEEIEIANGYPTFESYRVRFNNFAGSGQYIAIQNSSTMNGYVLVDNLSVSHLPACLEPENLTVDNASITGHEATLNWEGTSDAYRIDYRTAAYMDGVSEEFATTSAPTGWTRYSGALNTDGTGPTSPVSSAWYFGNNQFSSIHAYMNIYSTNKYWLVTPSITIADGDAFSFDVAYTAYNSTSAAATNGTDDRFLVLISTDEKAHWTTLREWNNSGSAFVLNDIPGTFQTVNNIDISSYTGQTVYIAFYGESTTSNADNTLRIDNVAIGTLVAAGDWQNVSATTTSKELTGLYPERDYEALVYGDCGTDGMSPEHSNIVTFTTGIACPAPTSLTNEEPASRSVALSWTENGSATAWDVCVNGDMDNLRTANTNTNFVLDNLLPSTEYNVKVRANCGSDGVSTDWSNTVTFTTAVACPVPTGLAVPLNTIGPDEAVITWTEIGEATAWQICKDDIEANPIDVNAGNATITGSTVSYTLQGLGASQNYTVKVRAVCGGEDGSSEWSDNVPFTSADACPKPVITGTEVTAHTAEVAWSSQPQNDNNFIVYYRTAEYFDGVNEEFAGTSIPSGWTRWTGLVDEVIAGTATLSSSSSGWSMVTGTTNVFSSKHVKLNIYGASVKYWLVTPEINLSANSAMSFDLAQTPYSYDGSSTSTASGTRDDDRLVVLITTDDGATWNILREWNNSGSSYVFNDISETPQPVNIPLTAYSGNVKVAFYGESTVNNNGDNDMHIDNVTIGATVAAGAWNEETVTGTTGTSHTLMLDNLEAETDYDVYVMGYCKGGAVESSSTTTTFTTDEPCAAPTTLAHGTATTTSVPLTWTLNGDNDVDWQICIDGDMDNLRDVQASEVSVTGTQVSYTLTGLVAAHNYTVKVRANCGMYNAFDDGQSGWSNETTFQTECDVINSFPWSETFDGFTNNTVAICWDNSTSSSSTISGSNSYYIWGVYNTSGENKMMRMYNSMVQNGTALINTPTIELPATGKYALTFDYSHRASCNAFEVKVSTDGTNFTTLGTYSKPDGTTTNTTNPGTLTKAVISLADYAGESIILQFFATANFGSGAIFVDNVKVVEMSDITKDVQDGKWYAISSPVNTPAVADVEHLTDGTYDFYRYNEASATWENYKAHTSTFTTFENGRGYIYRNSTGDDLIFTGVPNDGNPVTVPFTYTSSLDEHLKGFNLVGNPYTTEATLGKVCYKLNTNGTWAAQLASYAVQPLEGVLVQATSTTDEFAFSISSKSAPKAAQTIALTVSGNGYEDVAYAMLEEGKGLNKVAHLATEAPALSIPVDGSNYAIAYLGYEVESFPLTLNATAGEYTIALNNQISGLSYCHLLDKETGKETDLLKGAYTFKANGNSDRFTVLLNASLENGEIAIWNGNSWIVNGEGTLQVFDVMGRRVYNQEVAGQSSLNTDELATGVYVIRLGEKSQKIVVK